MKKLYYIDASTINGKTAHAMQIESTIKSLKKYFDLTLVSYYDRKKVPFCKHIGFKRPKLFNKIIPYSIFHFAYKLKKLKIEKNSLMFTRNLWIAYLFNKKFKKTIVELHDIPTIRNNMVHYILFDILLYNLPLLLINNNNKIILACISNGIRNDLKDKGIKNKSFILRDSVDIKKFDIQTSKFKIRENKKIALYVGSIQEWKGYKTFLEASRIIKDVSFYFVGGNDEEIKKLSKKYKNVNFVGFVNNNLIPKYLKAADILIIPNSAKYDISSKYTSPLKLFEYMAAKKPIIASDIPSIREVVSESEAVFFEPDNANDLAYKIKLLIKDLNKQEIISKNAFEKVKKFTWDKRAKKIKEIYDE